MDQSGCSQDEKSWLLYRILDGLVGSRDLVAIRRELTLIQEFVSGTNSRSIINAGSRAEGFNFLGSDTDTMLIENTVVAMYPDQFRNISPSDLDKTILFVRETDCQPGYVALEVGRIAQDCPPAMDSVVECNGIYYLSSELFRTNLVDIYSGCFGESATCVPHGPCITFSDECDYAFSFPFISWPIEANEWLNRSRHNGWPTLGLIDNIVQNCCHLVPVGDNSTPVTFIQWRISFSTAERKLIHSLSHVQFLVLGLLKLFLKQISTSLEQTCGDKDILSSYIMKTVLFWAVEITPLTFWHQRHTFVCFWFCLNILISWVKSGYCPNYFVVGNNMFLSKIHGENQQKLLHLLMGLHDMKWDCLSEGTFYRTFHRANIGGYIRDAIQGDWERVLLSPMDIEWQKDITVFKVVIDIFRTPWLKHSLELFVLDKSDMAVFVTYCNAVKSLANTGMDMYTDHMRGGSNKDAYMMLRRIKRFLSPLGAVCVSPGLLNIATYYYQTGNYIKALAMCEHMMSTFIIFLDNGVEWINKDRFQHGYCGQGLTYFDKRKVCASNVLFRTTAVDFCISQLRFELKTCSKHVLLTIPPLPYAVFLSFLCNHELGDIRRRDAALTHLRAVKYHPEQGGHKYGIVHTLVGICFETVGDNRRAIREYSDSMNAPGNQQWNPAMERIERLRHA